MKNIDLENKLKVGVTIKLGDDFKNKFKGFEGRKTITLINCDFDYENGLYTETQTSPGIENGDDCDSIYHLFGNDLEDFMDCEIMERVDNPPFNEWDQKCEEIKQLKSVHKDVLVFLESIELHAKHTGVRLCAKKAIELIKQVN